MGVVYKAEDIKLDRLVALKFLPSHLSASEQDKARFLQEAKAAAALNHPNICTIYGIEEVSGQEFIVMEFVDGETLRKKIGRTEPAGSLPTNDAISFAIQVGEALAEAHAKGIIHRDIKPENVMLNVRNQVKVMDFGLAKLKGSLRLTRHGVTVGTLAYMAPEQIRGEDIDERADIFSLGVLTFELLIGRLPFRGEYEPALMYSILNEQPLRLENFVKTPSGLQNVLDHALAKNREDRYRSAKAFVSELLAFQTSSLSEPISISRPKPPQTKYARSGDCNIAYQVVGDGPLDLIFVMGWVSHLDHYWEEQSMARFLNRLAAFSRLILFDKRGTGLSDRVHESELPTLEQRMDDLRAVMDAVGSKRAALFGVSEGGPMAALFAATYPQRTRALIMYGSYAKRIWDAEYPWAPTPEERQKFFDAIKEGWGGVVDLATMAPSVANDESFCEWWAAYLRKGASPGAAMALAKMNTQIDIRNILPSIHVPSLILHRTGDSDSHVGGSRYMAQRIPRARFVELAGNDHIPWVGNQDAILDEVERFLTLPDQTIELDRILATVLTVQVVDRGLRAEHHQRLRSIFRSMVDRYRGQEVRSMDTELLATFDGPARAIRAASEIVQSASDVDLLLKAGLHTGECDVIGSEVKGLAVEISSSIAASAAINEVLVSSTVRDLVAGSNIRFQEDGTLPLRGYDSFLKLYSVQSETAPVTMQTKEQRIAILPLANISQDPNDQFFADGMTEELISRLSKIRRLRMIARTSVMQYKGTTKSIAEISRELNVANVIEGSVRKSGNAVRIRIQLIDANSQEHLWSDDYDRDIKDIFAIQSDVAQRVAHALEIQLMGDEKRLIEKESTKNLEAYDLYLKGRYFLGKRTEESLNKAIDYFQQATARDATYALAYAGTSDAYMILALLEFLPPHEAFPKAKTAAAKAIDIDPSMAEAHASLGVVKFQYDWDWSGAEQEFKETLRLNPNYSSGHHYYADFLKALGRFDEALEEIGKAQQLDPLSLAINTGVGHVLYLSRRYDEAIEQYRKTLELDPNYLQARLWFGRPFLQKGMFQESIRELEAAVELSGGSTIATAMLGHARAAAGNKTEALKMLDELMKRSEKQYVPSYWIGMIYIGLGNMDQTFAWFNKAYEERSSWLVWMNVEPRFDALRRDPRFAALSKKMGLKQ